MFEPLEAVVKRVSWRPYPHMRPKAAANETHPVVVDDLSSGSIVYVNGFEAGISCMETELIAGRNAAMITVNYLSSFEM